MTEPTRPLPYPTSNPDGLWQTPSMTSPKAITAMGAVSLPHIRVIPVIVIPGIMGTNLCATTDPNKEKNRELAPGEPAWRPPNGTIAGGLEVKKWYGRTPGQRQRILDPATLDVDDSGDIDLSKMPTVAGFDAAQGRSRWWGEIHWESYGQLLYTLEHNLNSTFSPAYSQGSWQLQPHWLAVNAWDRRDWNTSSTGLAAPLTNAEFEKHAGFHFPVYACGYNWLLSNGESAKRLQQRVEDIIQYWSSRKFDCKQVILITHSMGGLVGRACAKNIPGKIAGIVHGVMPAMGAPVCYRRITYGTETSSPSKSMVGNEKMVAFAVIAGRTAAETTPVMATAAGPLELLPNHLYREPWLFVTTKQEHAPDRDILQLPDGNPYDMYRDMKSWYRLIDPALADPANMHNGDLNAAILRAIDQAENSTPKRWTLTTTPTVTYSTVMILISDHLAIAAGCVKFHQQASRPTTYRTQRLLPRHLTARAMSHLFAMGQAIFSFRRSKMSLATEPCREILGRSPPARCDRSSRPLAMIIKEVTVTAPC